MPKAKEIKNADGASAGFVVQCPACGDWHLFDGRWTFNGDFERPTFAPSMLVSTSVKGRRSTVCHSFVRDGRIQFLDDCAHGMRGTTHDLPEVD